MSGSTDKILQALEAEQIRRLNLTKEDLQKSYRKLAEQNFPDDQRIRFIADLGACKDEAYRPTRDRDAFLSDRKSVV